MAPIVWGMHWTEELADGGVRVFAVSGEFTPAVSERLARRMSALAEAGEDAFVIDLVGAEPMDPRAMPPLLCAARELRPTGGRVSVVFDPLLQVFAVEGLEDLHDVAVTREDAIAGLARHDPAAARR
jgi:hypothetical protein